ncbi:MAG: methyltransferase [Desulfonauticus sp.]|nr:methyltransferase [Desulfonauticus sp.]
MDLKQFPKILSQPTSDTGFRFAIDSLLLSCFARPKKKWSILDLGCGCGVVGLGMLLKNPKLNLQIIGLEKQIVMAQLARQNALKLNLNDSYKVIVGDVARIKKLFQKGEIFHQIVLNPPYRRPKTGKISPILLKTRAKFEQETSLDLFIQGAKFGLKNKGELIISYLSENLTYLLTILKKHNFEPKEILFIHPRYNQKSKIFLVKSLKNGNPGLTILPPLIIYQSDKKNVYTAQVKQICPFL